MDGCVSVGVCVRVCVCVWQVDDVSAGRPGYFLCNLGINSRHTGKEGLAWEPLDQSVSD